MAPMLPSEILLQIVRCTAQDDLAALCTTFDTITFSDAIYHKYNPRRYLRQLTPEVDALLTFMRNSSVVLSGSRAAGFFYENACTNESDWDFYCSAGHAGVAHFSYQMTTLGAMWEAGDWEEHEAEGYGAGFSILNGRLARQNIQVVWRIGTSAFESIVEFYSSIVQCFISGYCAASLYHKVSSRGELIAWELDPIEHPEKHRKAPACVENVRDIVAELLGLTNSSSTVHHKPRSLSDDGTLVINFKPHRRNLTKIQTVLHDETMKEILQLSWTEQSSGVASLNIEKGSRLPIHSNLLALKTAIRLKGEWNEGDLPPEYLELGVFTLPQEYKHPTYNVDQYSRLFGYNASRYETMLIGLGGEEVHEVPWMHSANRIMPHYSRISEESSPV